MDQPVQKFSQPLSQPNQAVSKPPFPTQPGVPEPTRKSSLSAIYGNRFFLVVFALVLLTVLIGLAILLSGKSGTGKKPLTEIQLIAQFEAAGLLSAEFKDVIINKKLPEERHPERATGSASRSRLGLSSLPSTYEYNAYAQQFSRLLAEYYGTRDGEVLNLAKEWRSLVAAKFPEEYAKDEKGGIYTIEER